MTNIALGQFTVKSGVYQPFSKQENINPAIHTEFGDFNVTWLTSLGLNYTHFVRTINQPNSESLSLTTNRVGIQLRVTYKNVVGFINNRVKDTISFINRQTPSCGTGSYRYWYRDVGFKFRPYLTVSPRFDINKSNRDIENKSISNGFGLSSFLGFEFFSINITGVKLNFYVDGGYHYDFYDNPWTNSKAYTIMVGTKLLFGRFMDADHAPDGLLLKSNNTF